ncbi:MAG: methyltransferase family protein [Adhaeribacter sp.]
MFKRRSWLPLVLYPFAIAILYFYPAATHQAISSEAWGLICFGICLSGQVVRAMTVGFTPKGTSGRNTDAGQVAETLNQTGIYSVVRHPLYLGNFLMWLGLFLFIGIWWFVLICALAYWLYYERIMYAEEEFLRRRYTSRYEAWASRTPAFLPRLSGWLPSNLNFSFRNVLKREYNGLFASVVSFALLNLSSNWLAGGRPLLDPLWQVILIAGGLQFVVLRTLKKSTRVLDMEGR